MSNNIVFKLFFAILMISSTATAAVDFETLSDPSYKISALNRAKALLVLSEQNTEFAEQCLDKIMEIAKGKYGLAKRRSANTEERTVVGKAITALRRLCPAKPNPFEKQEDTGEHDTIITRHVMVLKAGFDHIADLMRMEDTTQVEVFGIVFAIKKPTVTLTEPVKVLGGERDEETGHGRVEVDESLVDSVSIKQSDRRLPSDAADEGDEETCGLGTLDMSELMYNIRHQRGNTPSGSPMSSKSKRDNKAAAKGKRKGKDTEEVDGHDRGLPRAVAGLDSSVATTGLEGNEVVVQFTTEDDAAAQEEAERRKKEEEALRSKSGGGEDSNSGTASSGLSKQLPVIANNGTGPAVAATAAQGHTDKGEGDDDVVHKDNCCKREKKKKCTIC